MTLRPLIAGLLIVGSATAAAQVSGEFYLEKSTYAPGEPVFLDFKVTNDATEKAYILTADPYSFCSGYRVSVSNDPGPKPSCASGFGGSCGSGDTLLSPGRSKTERILLNFEHDITASGDYSVDASRSLPYTISNDDHLGPFGSPTIEVSTILHFRVDDTGSASAAEFQPFIEQLHSPDPAKRSDAARLLASTAPHFLEDTLLTFADNPEFRQYAPLAFHRLNTPRSIAAMAELLRKSQPGTYEHMKSAEYLAQSNDQQWFPLLRDVGVKNAGNVNYLTDAAELGGDQMLPTLIALTRSPDREYTVINAVTAMGSTGSRNALPLLLDLLQSPHPDIADRARYALRQLTHRTASTDIDNPPQSEYPKWSNWWRNQGRDAPIYKASDCGDRVPLD